MATYDNQSAEIVAAATSVGTVLSAIDSNGHVRKHNFTYTSSSNVDTDTVQLTEALPANAEIFAYAVVTSGTAAGAGATLDIGTSGGTATNIASDLDIAANGTDSAFIAPVSAGGQVVYMTYDGADPADGNVITGYILFSVA